MDTFLAYGCEPVQFVDAQADNLVEDIKLELNIKCEPEDVSELEAGSPALSGLDEDIPLAQFSKTGEFPKLKIKKKLRKVKKKSRKDKKECDYTSNSEDGSKKTKKGKSKRKKRIENRFRKRKENTYVTQTQQTLPQVKEAVFNTFKCGEGGILGHLKYKGVELWREKNTKGYSIRDEELDKFKRKQKKQKDMYCCEDCNYNVQFKGAFKVHFIMHANTFFIVESINKTLSKHFCYLCDLDCHTFSGLSQHLIGHRVKKEIIVSEDDLSDEDIKEDKCSVKSSPCASPLPVAAEISVPDSAPAPAAAPVPVVKEPHDVKDVPVTQQMSQPQPPCEPEVKDDLSSDGFVGFDDTDNLFQSDDEVKDEVKESDEKVVKGSIKVEIEYQPKEEVKKDVEIKKETNVNSEFYSELLSNFCFVKIERDADASFMAEQGEEGTWQGKVSKCKRCNYQVESGYLSRHRCKDVRQCDMCDKILLNQRIFRYHRKGHFCDKCPFKSPSLKAVIEHRRNSLECWSKCNNCDFKTINVQSFFRHVKSKTCHKDKKIKMEKLPEMLQCDTCAYKTHYKEILIKHMKEHKSWRYSSKESLMCNMCGKSCYSRTTLINHYKSHYCGKCPFMSVVTDEVLKHKKETVGCNYKCDKCEFTTPHTVSLRRHKRLYCGSQMNGVRRSRYDPNIAQERPDKASNTLHCDLCAYKTNSKIYLTNHIKKHLDPKPFQCSKCDFRCSQKGNLLIHEKKHIEGKSYVCSVCDFQCSHLKVFVIHKKIHGTEAVENKADTSDKKDPRFLYCDRCEFRTKYPQYLKNHILKHDNIRPYLCHYCGMTFISLIDYHVHKNQTHSNRPAKMYKCAYCDYTYNKKATVTIHERKHTGAKPYTCEFCAYTTSYSGNLRAHRKKHLTANTMEIVP